MYKRVLLITILITILSTVLIANANIYAYTHTLSNNLDLEIPSPMYIRTVSVDYSSLDKYHRYLYGFLRGVVEADVDGDKYPDLIYWFTGQIRVWDFDSGEYAVLKVDTPASMYYFKPIPLDVDSDGLEEIIISENNKYIDMLSIHYNYRSTLNTKLLLWDPLNNSVIVLAQYSGIYIDTSSYYYDKQYNRLYLVGASLWHKFSYSGYCYNYAWFKIYLVTIDLDNYSVSKRLIVYKYGCRRDWGYVKVNDITTSWHSFIIHYDNKLLIGTIGYDSILEISVDWSSGEITRVIEHSIGSKSLFDRLMHLIVPAPNIHMGGHGGISLNSLLSIFYPYNRLDWRIHGDKLYLVYGSYLNYYSGYFSYDASPITKYHIGNSYHPLYYRLAGAMGIEIIDLLSWSVTRVSLIGRIFDEGTRWFRISRIVSLEYIDYDSDEELEALVLATVYGFNRIEGRYYPYLHMLILYDIDSDTVVWYKLFYGNDINTSQFHSNGFILLSNHSIYFITPKTYLWDNYYYLGHELSITNLVDGETLFLEKIDFYKSTTAFIIDALTLDIDGDGVYEQAYPIQYIVFFGRTPCPPNRPNSYRIYPDPRSSYAGLIVFDKPVYRVWFNYKPYALLNLTSYVTVYGLGGLPLYGTGYSFRIYYNGTKLVGEYSGVVEEDNPVLVYNISFPYRGEYIVVYELDCPFRGYFCRGSELPDFLGGTRESIVWRFIGVHGNSIFYVYGLPTLIEYSGNDILYPVDYVEGLKLKAKLLYINPLDNKTYYIKNSSITIRYVLKILGKASRLSIVEGVLVYNSSSGFYEAFIKPGNLIPQSYSLDMVFTQDDPTAYESTNYSSILHLKPYLYRLRIDSVGKWMAYHSLPINIVVEVSSNNGLSWNTPLELRENISYKLMIYSSLVKDYVYVVDINTNYTTYNIVIPMEYVIRGNMTVFVEGYNTTWYSFNNSSIYTIYIEELKPVAIVENVGMDGGDEIVVVHLKLYQNSSYGLEPLVYNTSIFIDSSKWTGIPYNNTIVLTIY